MGERLNRGFQLYHAATADVSAHPPRTPTQMTEVDDFSTGYCHCFRELREESGVAEITLDGCSRRSAPVAAITVLLHRKSVHRGVPRKAEIRARFIWSSLHMRYTKPSFLPFANIFQMHWALSRQSIPRLHPTRQLDPVSSNYCIQVKNNVLFIK